MEKTILSLVACLFFSAFAQASSIEGQLFSPTSVYPGLSKDTPFIVEFGFEYLHTAIPNINDVIVENTAISDMITHGNVVNDYPDVFAQTLSAQVLIDSDHRWTASLKTFLPLNSLTQMDTGNIYQPEYVLYRTEMQRPRVLAMSGLNLGENWRVGLGADVGFSVDTTANVFLESGAGKYSDQRISAKLKPTIAPQASVQYQTYTFTARAENRSDMNLTAGGGAVVFGTLDASKNFNYTTQSSLYYEPPQFELAGTTTLATDFDLIWGVSYQLWSKFKAPAALIQTVSTNSCAGQPNCSDSFDPSLAPSFQARNIVVPEAGFGWKMGENHYQLSYRFKDSIFKGLPTGNGNYLDPPRHDLIAQIVFPFASGWALTVDAQVSRLASQTVTKTDANEIGAPGYTASGWLYGGGASLLIPLRYK